MDPFNIVIKKDGTQLGLNIHPKDKLSYMVLYEGALVGEVFLDEQGNAWGAIPAKELIGGSYPDYPCDDSVDCRGLLLDVEMVQLLGREISKVMNITS